MQVGFRVLTLPKPSPERTVTVVEARTESYTKHQSQPTHTLDTKSKEPRHSEFLESLNLET